MLQFLIEALTISLIGCLIGILLSWGILAVISAVGGMAFGVNGTVALAAIAFSLGIGVLFGLYPANKAAKKAPIEALRYDG